MNIPAKTLLFSLFLTTPALAAPLATSTCNEAHPAPACHAVRGDRADGWLPQGRSEVMARNGMVTTSQPLAAQTGLEILRQGGNAVDAAVATAAVLNLIEPMNVGMAGDLFAIIYTAKDHKLHVLNASGMAASGANLGLHECAWLPAGSREYGPRIGHAARGRLDRDRAGRGLGLAGGAGQIRHHEFQAGAGARRALMPSEGVPVSRTHRQ